MDGADDRRDEVLVGTITRQYSFLFVLSLPEIEWLYCISLSLCLLPSFPSASLKVNVLTTLQNTQSIPPSPPAPTHLEQPWGTPHGASPTVSFSAPLSSTSFGGLVQYLSLRLCGGVLNITRIHNTHIHSLYQPFAQVEFH